MMDENQNQCKSSIGGRGRDGSVTTSRGFRDSLALEAAKRSLTSCGVPCYFTGSAGRAVGVAGAVLSLDAAAATAAA
jgi:hypothetical protein